LAMIGPERRFEPAMNDETRNTRLAAWSAALASV
jgi:hypothetical protein